MIILNSLLPVFFLVVLGNLLKRFELTNDIFLQTSDKLVYFIFFPALLFWKIGGSSDKIGIDLHFFLAVTSAVLILYAASLAAIKIFDIADYQAGSFSQSCYRFNTYIGMAVVMNVFGEKGVTHFGILVGFIIPIINVLAVSTLIWFSGLDFNLKQRARITVRALISNPLIIACLLGMAYSRIMPPFPVFVEKTFRLMTHVTLPLALLSIGGALKFAKLKGLLTPSLLASALKLFVLPAIGYALFKAFSISGMQFKAGMIFFVLPTSTAIYVLSSQLNSDTELASASIVVSTVISSVSMSIMLIILDKIA